MLLLRKGEAVTKLGYLFNRTFHRREWREKLKTVANNTRLNVLSKMTAQTILKRYSEIIEGTAAIRAERSADDCAAKLAYMEYGMYDLQSLLPFADLKQQAMITDAERTIQYARSLVPLTPAKRKETEMTYYSVYIPSLDGCFYYLGTQEFHPEDIVLIPFGGENRMIYGIVKQVLNQDYWKMPIPMWKMKYIDSKAPEAVIAEYWQQMQQR